MFADKIAVVTGGGSGIDRAIALAFSRQLAQVVVLDKNAEAGAAVATEIGRSGGNALAVCTDVSSSTQVAAAFEEIRKHTPQIDILVNSAGIYVYKTAVTLDETDWERCMDVDLKGAWLCSKDALPMIIAAGGGSIINIGSTHAVRAQAQAFPYGVAKGGLLSLTQSLAVDFGREGVRVNAICPGLVFSPLTTDYLERNPKLTAEQLIALQPLPIKITPEDVAHAAVFLASDGARCITGATIYVDGGRTILAGIRHGE